MFSVLTPLYNKESSIRRTIDSVLAQSCPDFELLIIDDGSTDGSIEKVKSLKDERINIVKKKNGGVSSARNMGIRVAKHDWIAFLDADDLWHKDYLFEIHTAISASSAVNVVTTDFAYITNTGSIISKFEANTNGFVDYFEITNKLGWHIMNMSTLCVNKKTLEKVGPFREDMTHGEDMDFFEKLARIGKVWLVGKILSFYVQDAENRAMLKFPNIYKTRTYNIDTKGIQGAEERKYYKKAILNSIHRSLFQMRFKRAAILFRRHWGFITFHEVLLYILGKLVKKFSKP